MAWWHNYCHGCYRCKKSLSDDQPFFRCIACDINFDLECALVPRFIKSKCHIHTLTLVDSFVEDDSGEYYCDVCEEERNPKHHVYICEECQGLFVAHIECVLNKMVEEIAAAD
ncbi:DC1 domain-containing protein [Corchorus olitorius]|uniref:DC1 domain-containing protein n=1 Tax=Corchorus olitorius TaxID=93759 RepID=A0A1R3JMM8_9ROSI|nr:DC1 domain-containing protein [Corchorus olitorius]